jgi:hypothetical protein
VLSGRDESVGEAVGVAEVGGTPSGIAASAESGAQAFGDGRAPADVVGPFAEVAGDEASIVRATIIGGAPLADGLGGDAAGSGAPLTARRCRVRSGSGEAGVDASAGAMSVCASPPRIGAVRLTVSALEPGDERSSTVGTTSRVVEVPASAVKPRSACRDAVRSKPSGIDGRPGDGGALTGDGATSDGDPICVEAGAGPVRCTCAESPSDVALRSGGPSPSAGRVCPASPLLTTGGDGSSGSGAGARPTDDADDVLGGDVDGGDVDGGVGDVDGGFACADVSVDRCTEGAADEFGRRRADVSPAAGGPPASDALEGLSSPRPDERSGADGVPCSPGPSISGLGVAEPGGSSTAGGAASVPTISCVGAGEER